MKTSEKILAAALQMFNAQGVAQVSTNRIAAELEMSPGNLYYHFKSKQAIVERLLRHFERALEPLRDTYKGIQALDDLWLAFHLCFEVVERYRFIYHDIDYLVREFPSVRKSAEALTLGALKTTRRLCERLVELGIAAMSESEVDLVAHHIVMTLTCWDSFSRLLPKEGRAANSPGLAAYHVLTLLMPYVGPRERQYLDYLRHKYVG